MGGQQENPAPARHWRFLYWLVLALLALRFADVYYAPAFELSEATLASLLAGTAETPFQYRILSVWVLRLAIEGLGLPAPLAVTLLAWASVLALLLLLARLGQAVGLDRRLTLLAVALVFYPLTNGLVALEYLRFWYPWDLPQVALVAAAWLCLLEGRLRLYALVFLVATVNRETSFFLAFLFLAVLWGRWPLPRLLAALAAQAAVWLAFKLAVGALYAGNPGAGLAGFKLLENADALLSHPLDSLVLLAQFGGAWVPVLLFRRWIPHDLVRRSLLAIPPFLAMLLIVANLYEVRVLVELTPLVWLSAALLAARWLGMSPMPASDRPRSPAPPARP